MKVLINKKQLNKINYFLGLNIKSGDFISYNKFLTYNISLSEILSYKLYNDIFNYFEHNNKYINDNKIYFNVTI